MKITLVLPCFLLNVETLAARLTRIPVFFFFWWGWEKKELKVLCVPYLYILTCAIAQDTPILSVTFISITSDWKPLVAESIQKIPFSFTVFLSEILVLRPKYSQWHNPLFPVCDESLSCSSFNGMCRLCGSVMSTLLQILQAQRNSGRCETAVASHLLHHFDRTSIVHCCMDNPGRVIITLEEAKLNQQSFEFMFFPMYSWSAVFLDAQSNS